MWYGMHVIRNVRVENAETKYVLHEHPPRTGALSEEIADGEKERLRIECEMDKEKDKF